MAANHIMDMYITANSATAIYYLVRKHLHNTRQAKQVMEKLFSLTGILNVTGEDCVNALASPISDYNDAVVERVARNAEIDYIITRNTKDYQQGTIKCILPDEFIAQMKTEE